MELVLHILESAYYDERTLEPDYAVLRNSALVCSDWREAAQRLLFRHVVLRTKSAYLAFADAVAQDTAHAQLLSENIVRLRATVDLSQPNGIAMDSFAHALSLVPNLYELDLSLFGSSTRSATASSSLGQVDPAELSRNFPSLPAPLMSALKLARPRALTALALSNWSDNTKLTTQLLSVFGSRASRESECGPLRFLSLRGANPPAAPLRSALAFASDLTGLRMSFQKPPSSAFATWLLNNTTALESLELERDAHPDLLAHLVHLQPCITSLALPACTTSTVPALSKLAALRELRVEDPWLSPSTFRALPLGALEHLALGIGRETPLRVALDAIVRAPKLQAVTAMVWDENPFVEEMRTAAAQKAVPVAWKTVRDVRVFRSLVVRGFPVTFKFLGLIVAVSFQRADPLPTESYPRAKHVDNLQRMRAIVAAATPAFDRYDCADSYPCGSGSSSRSPSPDPTAAHSRQGSFTPKHDVSTSS